METLLRYIVKSFSQVAKYEWYKQQEEISVHKFRWARNQTLVSITQLNVYGKFPSCQQAT